MWNVFRPYLKCFRRSPRRPLCLKDWGGFADVV